MYMRWYFRTLHTQFIPYLYALERKKMLLFFNLLQDRGPFFIYIVKTLFQYERRLIFLKFHDFISQNVIHARLKGYFITNNQWIVIQNVIDK